MNDILYYSLDSSIELHVISETSRLKAFCYIGSSWLLKNTQNYTVLPLDLDFSTKNLTAFTFYPDSTDSEPNWKC